MLAIPTPDIMAPWGGAIFWLVGVWVLAPKTLDACTLSGDGHKC